MNLILLVISIFSVNWCESSTISATSNAKEIWTLNIIHMNDLESRFEETNVLSSECSPREKSAGECYGGFARIATMVRKARSRNSKFPALFLNAGDTYQGTRWFSHYKWKIAAKFMNILEPDAASLGNHEFDEGPASLVPYLRNVTFPIVASNLDLSGEPEMAASNITNSVILNVQGRQIGIIGYLTPDTKRIADTGKIIFFDEIECIRKEAKKLKDEGVNILIALGHSGFDVDQQIAAEVEDIDLVIGGHTHTFLYTGNKPSAETPEALYPTEVRQKNGRRVYVVQAYAFTKYLGNLLITFDSAGEIHKILGSPILLDKNIEQAPDVLKELEKWRSGLNNETDEKLGFTRVFLNGDRTVCRRRECNLANLIVDAMVDNNIMNYAGNDGWTDAAIAILNSGVIRGSISKLPNEPITTSDTFQALSLGNTVGKITVTGKQLLQALEHSVAEFSNDPRHNKLTGQFLHLSGIQVAYDLSLPVNARVLPNSVYIRCAQCFQPEYQRLQFDKEYKLLISNYVYNGGNGFTMFKSEYAGWTSLGERLDEVLADYIKKKKYLTNVGTERRIRFVNWSDCANRRRRRRHYHNTKPNANS